MDIRPFHALRTWKVHVVIFSFHATHFHTLFTPLVFRYVNTRFDLWSIELSANHRTVSRVRTLVVFVSRLAPKYILLLLTHFRIGKKVLGPQREKETELTFQLLSNLLHH